MHPVRTSGWRCLIYAALPQHFLNFLPEPQGHGSLRPTLVGVRAGLVDDPDGSGIDLLRSLSPRVGGDRGAGWRICSNNRPGNLTCAPEVRIQVIWFDLTQASWNRWPLTSARGNQDAPTFHFGAGKRLGAEPRQNR